MKTWNTNIAQTMLALAVATTFPAAALAQSNEELLKELKA